MQNMVYIKRHAEIRKNFCRMIWDKFSKKWKNISKSIWQNEKVCYIKLLSRFSDDRQQNDGSEKKFEKKSNFAWQS